MADLKPLVGLSLDFASLAVKFTEETKKKQKKHKNKIEKLESFMTHSPCFKHSRAVWLLLLGYYLILLSLASSG
jgi:hypothetical protein